MSTIHIYVEDDGVEVWLDPDPDGGHAGLCIGAAANGAEAIKDAIEDLSDALKRLGANGTSPKTE